MKTIGLGSGAFMMAPITVFGKDAVDGAQLFGQATTDSNKAQALVDTEVYNTYSG